MFAITSSVLGRSAALCSASRSFSACAQLVERAVRRTGTRQKLASSSSRRNRPTLPSMTRASAQGQREPPTSPSPDRAISGRAPTTAIGVRFARLRRSTSSGRDEHQHASASTATSFRSSESTPTIRRARSERDSRAGCTCGSRSRQSAPCATPSSSRPSPARSSTRPRSKAIARWRYNPRVESGEAVERVGLANRDSIRARKLSPIKPLDRTGQYTSMGLSSQSWHKRILHS